jgi:hypothetical protein
LAHSLLLGRSTGLARGVGVTHVPCAHRTPARQSPCACGVPPAPRPRACKGNFAAHRGGAKLPLLPLSAFRGRAVVTAITAKRGAAGA